jgi:hypothetical protein
VTVHGSKPKRTKNLQVGRFLGFLHGGGGNTTDGHLSLLWLYQIPLKPPAPSRERLLFDNLPVARPAFVPGKDYP